MESCLESTLLRHFKSAFAADEEGGTEVANVAMDLFRQMADQVANAEARVREAEWELRLCKNRLATELELNTIYEKDIEKLEQQLEDTKPQAIQLQEAKKELDFYQKQVQVEIQLRERYEREIVKYRDLAWDREGELEKLQAKLEEEAKIRSKLESELRGLRLHVQGLNSSTSALERDKNTAVPEGLRSDTHLDDLPVATMTAYQEIDLQDNIPVSSSTDKYVQVMTVDSDEKDSMVQLPSAVVELNYKLLQAQQDMSCGHPLGQDKGTQATPVDCKASSGHLDGQDPAGLRGGNLLERDANDATNLDQSHVTTNSEACSAILCSHDNPLQDKSLPIPTTDKSVQVTNCDSEEKDILIQHLKMNLEVVLKELEQSRSLQGSMVSSG